MGNYTCSDYLSDAACLPVAENYACLNLSQLLFPRVWNLDTEVTVELIQRVLDTPPCRLVLTPECDVHSVAKLALSMTPQHEGLPNQLVVLHLYVDGSFHAEHGASWAFVVLSETSRLTYCYHGFAGGNFSDADALEPRGADYFSFHFNALSRTFNARLSALLPLCIA